MPEDIAAQENNTAPTAAQKEYIITNSMAANLEIIENSGYKKYKLDCK